MPAAVAASIYNACVTVVVLVLISIAFLNCDSCASGRKNLRELTHPCAEAKP